MPSFWWLIAGVRQGFAITRCGPVLRAVPGRSSKAGRLREGALREQGNAEAGAERLPVRLRNINVWASDQMLSHGACHRSMGRVKITRMMAAEGDC